MQRKELNQSQHSIQSIDELKKLTLELSKQLREKELLMLDGPLGAGKTEFVKALVMSLGGDEIPMSPSFALHNIYSTKRGDVDHLDLYRLETEDELESSGFWDLFEKDSGLIIVEWAERLEKAHIPLHWSMTSLKIHESEGARQFNWVQFS